MPSRLQECVQKGMGTHDTEEDNKKALQMLKVVGGFMSGNDFFFVKNSNYFYCIDFN